MDFFSLSAMALDQLMVSLVFCPSQYFAKNVTHGVNYGPANLPKMNFIGLINQLKTHLIYWMRR